MAYMTTQELMDLYGVSWFKMDESVGNSIIDSKGSATAVFTGSLATVEGVSGNAKHFPGNSIWVRFGTRVLPLGKKSIRFKFKNNNQANVYIMGNSQSDYMQHGEHVRINGSGNLAWDSYAFASGVTRFSVVSSTKVNDNLWHDVLLTWDGTTELNGVKMYIDDVYTPHKTGTASLTETTTQSNNFAIAVNPSNNSGVFTGYIDEIEIYNEVITLSPPPVNKILLAAGEKYYSIHEEYDIDIIPKQSAANAQVTFSSQNTSGGHAFQLFDKNDKISSWASAAGVARNQWVAFNFNAPTESTKYALACGGFMTYMPKNWRIEGSNDNLNWDVIDERSNVTWVKDEIKTYEFKQKVKYSIYRLFVIDNDSGTTSNIRVEEWYLYNTVKPKLVELSEANENGFLNYGMDSDISIDTSKPIDHKVFVGMNPELLGSGRVFKQKIDASKTPIKKASIT